MLPVCIGHTSLQLTSPFFLPQRDTLPLLWCSRARFAVAAKPVEFLQGSTLWHKYLIIDRQTWRPVMRRAWHWRLRATRSLFVTYAFQLLWELTLVIKLNLAIVAQPALFQELSILLYDIFECDTLIRKNLQVVADQMAIFASGTRYEGSAEMVGLLRHAMRATVQTFAAGEGQLVGWLLLFACCYLVALAEIFGRRGGCRILVGHRNLLVHCILCGVASVPRWAAVHVLKS